VRSTACARPSAGRPTTSDYTFITKLSGQPIGALWDAADWDGSNDWEFTSAADDAPKQLYALWDGAVERSRSRLDAALADGGLDQLVHVSSPDGRHASLRRLLRPDRGVRPAHRPRRPAPRGCGWTGWRGPSGWMARKSEPVMHSSDGVGGTLAGSPGPGPVPPRGGCGRRRGSPARRGSARRRPGGPWLVRRGRQGRLRPEPDRHRSREGRLSLRRRRLEPLARRAPARCGAPVPAGRGSGPGWLATARSRKGHYFDD